MSSTYNEGKSVIAERFIRTLKNKIYKYMTNIFINNIKKFSDDIANGYSNTYHKTIMILLMILMMKKILELFMKKKSKKQTNKNLG